MPEILVLNAGSSSVKASVYAAGPDGPALTVHGQVDGVGTPHPMATGKTAAGDEVLRETWADGRGPKTVGDAVGYVVERLALGRPGWAPAAVGHRVVHGGERFAAPVRIDPGVRAYLESLVPLAPLHQPGNLAGVDAAARAFPGAPQVACFDTAFHRGRAFESEAFALPRSLFDAGVRRYGFHGLSYEYIARRLRAVAPDVAGGRVVVAHLGNGVSLCGLRGGRSVETTMSFTALDGMPMGTRCGAVDPGALLYLLAETKLTPDALADLLYKQSGLLGLSGVGSDMRDLLASADPRAADAVRFFVYRLVGCVGQLAAALGGLDAVVFTAGIGEHSADVRERVCRGLGWLGVDLDDAANRAGGPRITAAGSRVSAWAVPTDEEKMIALHVGEVLGW